MTLEEELKKELAQFVYQHAWSSYCQTAANYTGFHMINVFLEKLQNTSSNSEYKSPSAQSCNGCIHKGQYNIPECEECQRAAPDKYTIA